MENRTLCALIGKHPISVGIGEGASNGWFSDLLAFLDDRRLAFHRNDKFSNYHEFSNIDTLEEP